MVWRKLVSEILVVLDANLRVRPRYESVKFKLIVESLVKTSKLVNVSFKSLNINP